MPNLLKNDFYQLICDFFLEKSLKTKEIVKKSKKLSFYNLLRNQYRKLKRAVNEAGQLPRNGIGYHALKNIFYLKS